VRHFLSRHIAQQSFRLLRCTFGWFRGAGTHGLPQAPCWRVDGTALASTATLGYSEIGMIGKNKTRWDWVRVLVLSLTALFVLFVAQGLSHSHANGRADAACQVCQAAHIGSAPKVLTPSLSSPLIATGYVQPFIVAIHEELFSHGSPSRAPPTA
jgi:hypothetical protein